MGDGSARPFFFFFFLLFRDAALPSALLACFSSSSSASKAKNISLDFASASASAFASCSCFSRISIWFCLLRRSRSTSHFRRSSFQSSSMACGHRVKTCSNLPPTTIQ